MDGTRIFVQRGGLPRRAENARFPAEICQERYNLFDAHCGLTDTARTDNQAVTLEREDAVEDGREIGAVLHYIHVLVQLATLELTSLLDGASLI